MNSFLSPLWNVAVHFVKSSSVRIKVTLMPKYQAVKMSVCCLKNNTELFPLLTIIWSSAARLCEMPLSQLFLTLFLQLPISRSWRFFFSNQFPNSPIKTSKPTRGCSWIFHLKSTRVYNWCQTDSVASAGRDKVDLQTWVSFDSTNWTGKYLMDSIAVCCVGSSVEVSELLPLIHDYVAQSNYKSRRHSGGRRWR